MASTSLADIYKELYKSNTGDITIQLSDDTELKIHSLFLTLQSDVFSNMLSQDTVERKNKIIDMSSYDILLVKNFLEYLYTGSCDFKNINICIDLIDMFDMYIIKLNFNNITDFIKKNINVDNIFEISQKCLSKKNVECFKNLTEYLDEIICNNLSRYVDNKKYFNLDKCYDDIKPGEIYLGIARPTAYKYHTCCEHQKIQKSYLSLNNNLQFKDKIICINSDDNILNLETSLCCLHRKMFQNKFNEQSKDVQAYYLNMIFFTFTK